MITMGDDYSGDVIRGLYQETKTAASKVRAKYRTIIAAEIAAVKEAFEDYVLEARLHDLVSVQRMADDMGVARTSVYAALDSALERRGMTRADLAAGNVAARIGAVVADAKRQASKFAIRREFRGKIHVAVNGALGDGIVNVYLDPVEMRVLNVSEHENGIREEMAGPRVDAWQAELDSDGSALRLTVDDWKGA